MISTKRISEYAIMIALAIVLGYLEMQIPVFIAVPGMKLGLTNIVVLIALYLRGNKSAIAVNIIRIFLVSLLFGTAVSLFYSLAGGILSCIVMMLLKHTQKFGIITVSIAGGVTHNIGQILVAMLLLETTAIGWYLFILWFTGIICGALVGFLGYEIIKRLSNNYCE